MFEYQPQRFVSRNTTVGYLTVTDTRIGGNQHTGSGLKGVIFSVYRWKRK